MTLHLDWPAEVVARFTEEARQKGLTLDAYLLEAILRHAPPKGGAGGEADKQRARDEAGRSIRELREGNILGSELTVRDLIEEGLRF